MRIFITGGGGFVGLPTVKILARGGHQLLVLSRHPQKIKLAVRKGKVQFIKGDLSNIGAWSGTLTRFKPDVALHLAWEGIPDYGSEMSLRNLFYGLNLFDLLSGIGCKKIVVSGSCWEYGAVSSKLKEDRKLEPASAFSAAKVALQIFGSQISKERNCQFIWARIFYVYGPGKKKGSLIPYLIDRKNNNLPPEVQNPKKGNDFVYIEDVARALSMMVTKRVKNQNEVYNIGSGRITSVESIVSEIYVGKRPRARKGRGFYADISKIKKEIGWAPKVKIKDGILRTVRYYGL